MSFTRLIEIEIKSIESETWEKSTGKLILVVNFQV